MAQFTDDIMLELNNNNNCTLATLVNQPNMRKIVIGTIYRPPQGDVKEFVKILNENIIDIMGYKNLELYIMGDSNIDYNRSSPNKTLLNDLKANTGLRQIINQTTRYGSNNKCTIDLVFTNSGYIMEQGTLNVNISDHEAVYVVRKKAKEKFNVIEGWGRSYINYDKNDFQDNVKSLSWPVWEINDVNECWELMEENIRAVADKLYPVKKLKIKDKGDPWVSPEIIAILHDKDRLRKKAKKTERKEDWERIESLRNFANTSINKAKADLIKNECYSL